MKTTIEHITQNDVDVAVAKHTDSDVQHFLLSMCQLAKQSKNMLIDDILREVADTSQQGMIDVHIHYKRQCIRFLIEKEGKA
jgi:hypothetical protein